MTRVGALFAGYGGLEMAVQAVIPDTEVVWVSENDPNASLVLAHHHPEVPNLGDITKIDWSEVPPVDVLTLGFPCQDVSHAGKRAGLTPDSRSGLWAHGAHAIAALRPALVVVENVRGLLSAQAQRSPDAAPIPSDALEESHAEAVQAALSESETAGDLGPDDGDVGEPESAGPVHLRALGAVLGDLAELGYDARWVGLRAADVGGCHGRFRVFLVAHPSADGADQRFQRSGPAWGWRSGLADGDLLPTPTTRDWKGHNQRGDATCLTGALLPTPTSMDSHASGGGYNGQTNVTLTDATARQPDRWGIYADAIARWERLTRAVPAPTVLSSKGTSQLSPRFSEWMMGLPDGHVTGVPGLTRNAQLKILGNGVVPQQAAVALDYLLTQVSDPTGGPA